MKTSLWGGMGSNFPVRGRGRSREGGQEAGVVLSSSPGVNNSLRGKTPWVQEFTGLKTCRFLRKTLSEQPPILMLGFKNLQVITKNHFLNNLYPQTHNFSNALRIEGSNLFSV